MFIFLQIRELLNGNFNWLGFAQLILFLLMGLIIVGFTAFAVYKTFQPKPKKKDDAGIN